MDNQINADNGHKITANVIVDVANGPVSTEAAHILQQANKLIVPDILANSGGVTVSYFEWVQNQANQQWDLDDLI